MRKNADRKSILWVTSIMACSIHNRHLLPSCKTWVGRCWPTSYHRSMSRTEERASGSRRRADAQRNAESIIDAALEGGMVGDDLNMAAVARLAGVSRVTLYSHFPTREALLEAAVDRAVAESDQLAEDLRLDEDPAPEALARLVCTSWQTLARYRALYGFASAELPNGRLMGLHGPLFSRVRKLVLRGRREGSFRTDLPVDWLVATVFSIMHQAADAVAAGRLPQRNARKVIRATVASVMSPS
jgi:TetR/AcrR family transcriptional regulator, mexCD-oprJ operon repressor